MGMLTFLTVAVITVGVDIKIGVDENNRIRTGLRDEQDDLKYKMHEAEAHVALPEENVDQTSLVQKKAQGTCSQDTFTCPSGEAVVRDPITSCRFAACAGQTSLVEMSNGQPTFSWTGVSIDENQNFCTRMTPVLGSYEDNHVADCAAITPVSDCEKHYVHVLDGKVGDIEHCMLNGDVCSAGAVHNCTWSFYMEDLIKRHGETDDNCAAKLLEAKRSLDGLLHSVQDVYNQLMQWNSIVQAENGTIRGLLEQQQEDWDVYVSAQGACGSKYAELLAQLPGIEAEVTELTAIANPDVRSAVDVNRASGYQENAANGVSETHALLEHASFAEKAASFAELDQSACKTFVSFVEKAEKKHGIKLTQTPDCHQARSDLQAEFTQAFNTLSDLHHWISTENEENRTICLNTATYNYKASVEGLDGVDDQIQDAAGKIHEAQGEIARLEPMLHDVERAVERMRTYVTTVSTECQDEEYLGTLYGQIRQKIIELQECPGRNDFTITVPHWTTTILANGGATPVPTPWYDDPKAAGVRNQL